MLNRSSYFAILFEITICILSPLVRPQILSLLPNGIARYLSNFMKLSKIEELDFFLRKYVCMVITYSRVWINRVRLPILLVVS